MEKHIDLHCDTIMQIRDLRKKGQDVELRDNFLHIDLLRMKYSKYMAQCFAMFTFLKNNPDPYQDCLDMIKIYKEEITKNSDLIKEAKTYDEILENDKNGLLSAILTLEDSVPCGDSIEKLHEFYNLGVRMISLTWNFSNDVGHPNFNLPNTREEPIDFYTPNTSKEYGLTDFGKQFVNEMDKLGIIVDVSHLSDAGFYDVANIIKGPFIASHSNARSLCPVVRNLTDEMIKIVIEHRGVIGINYAASFVVDKKEQVTIEDTVKHIIHIKELGGIDSIALGSDFDGIGNENELNNILSVPKLFFALRKAGFTEEEIEKISYKNVLRVFKEVLK